MQVPIIGISGRAGAGKDTLADYLKFRQLIVSKISIASTLKQLCTDLFGISIENMYTGKDNISEIVVTTDMAKLLGGLWDRIGTHLTIRELLQYFGTDMLRKFDDDCLIRATLLKIKDRGNETWAIPDVRFPNEVLAIKNMGGIIIRLTRNPSGMSHISECALDNYTGFDLVYNNENETVQDTMENVTTMLEDMGAITGRIGYQIDLSMALGAVK